MTGPKKAGPTVGQVQRRVRAVAQELDVQADALDVQSHAPRRPTERPGPDGQPVFDWNRLAQENAALRARATELRELATRIRDAAKG